jgi:pectate lyase
MVGCAVAGEERAVFPGAEGFGTTTPAGRYGAILKVKNLNDSGPGSLREAVEARGPRIVVFEVSGTITLSSPLIITKPYITIAGQSAPSPGITLRRAGLTVKTTDVLVQHLRIRVGDERGGSDPSNRDAVQILSPSARVVIDHVSASWAIDENGSTWDVSDVTISNAIFSEALNKSLHYKGEHSMGFLVGDKSKRIALIGNLFAHNHDRQPLIKSGASVLHLNNLVYNPGGAMYVGVGIDDEGSGPAYLSAVGNVFYRGINTPAKTPLFCYAAGGTSASGTQVYLEDNLHPDGFVWRGPSDMKVTYKPADTWTSPLTVRRVGIVEEWVLGKVGARPFDRDAVDVRIIKEVKSRTGNLIDSPFQVGGWPTLAQNVRPFVIPPNPNGDDDGNGYTKIEEILNQMAAEVEGRIEPVTPGKR